ATHFAVVAGHDGSPDGPGPLFEIQVIPAGGGTPLTWYQSTQNSVDLDGWWPDGGGLLYWIDPGSSEALDGIELYTQSSGSAPVPLATTLVSPSVVAWAPDARQPDLAKVALVAGGDRFIWGGDKHVETCDPVTAACAPVAEPAGTVGLSPAWASDRQVYFVAASDTGPFGPGGGADFSDGWLSLWDASARLYVTTAQGPGLVVGTGAGVVDAVPAKAGGMLFVRDDALWLLPPSAAAGPAVRVAGPLFSGASPGGYYGQVDWPSMFAWSQPAAA
ncbi:MAG TPA: hypothetical protein VED63_12025, partial [Acidimicrobiales bacterium]|nr:hypothetical protein [Acidimicrobiales bacterium]